jgi:hypothetical protein
MGASCIRDRGSWRHWQEERSRPGETGRGGARGRPSLRCSPRRTGGARRRGTGRPLGHARGVASASRCPAHLVAAAARLALCRLSRDSRYLGGVPGTLLLDGLHTEGQGLSGCGASPGPGNGTPGTFTPRWRATRKMQPRRHFSSTFAVSLAPPPWLQGLLPFLLVVQVVPILLLQRLVWSIVWGANLQVWTMNLYSRRQGPRAASPGHYIQEDPGPSIGTGPSMTKLR